MAICNFYRSRQQRQKGVIAIEFVFIFPILFLICYATISYALAFLSIQNMTYTGEEVLRKAMGFDDSVCENIDPANTTEIAACEICEEQEGATKAECKINAIYNIYASELLLFAEASDLSRYSSTIFCEANLICSLEMKTEPLIPVSFFGFTLLNLTDNKLTSKASLLF